ncbi:MAG: response regulator, partial [Methanobacteriota archaeon]
MNSKKRILIVDDDESQRRTLTYILHNIGYFIESAGTGKEALEVAGSSSIDLVLLDIKLPDTEGIDLVAPLRQINPDIAIIMVTGFASVENTVRSLNVGASGYLIKPINTEEMLTKVQNLLERQTLIQEKRQAVEALRISEWKFRNLIETLQEGIWSIDKDAKTTFVNHHMADMLGYSIGEMTGKSLFDFMDEQGKRIARLNIERRESGLKESHDFEFLKKDGSRMFASLETGPVT